MEKKLYIVYRYVDQSDQITKYIGITCKQHKIRSLESRIKEHCKKDEWAKGNFRVDYFSVNSQTDAEAFESHLIALYETYKFYNKAKADWGVSSFLPIDITWNKYITYNKTFSFSSKRRDDFLYEHYVKEVDFNKKYKIWFGTNGCWNVYVPDPSQKTGRKIIRRKNKNDLEESVHEYYLRHEWIK